MMFPLLVQALVEKAAQECATIQSMLTVEQKLQVLDQATRLYTAGRVGSLQEGIERVLANLREESLWQEKAKG